MDRRGVDDRRAVHVPWRGSDWLIRVDGRYICRQVTEPGIIVELSTIFNVASVSEMPRHRHHPRFTFE